MTSSFADLAHLAVASAGAFDRSMATASGFGNSTVRRLEMRGEWVEVLPAVWRSAATPLTRSLQKWAAIKYLGADAFLSHGTAAAHHHFLREPEKIWVSAGTHIHRTVPPRLVLTRTRHAEFETLPGGLPVATPARAMADLAMVHDRRELTAALARGIQSRKFTIDELAGQVELLTGRPGTSLIRKVMTEFDPAFESILSVDLFELFDLLGLHSVVPQFSGRPSERALRTSRRCPPAASPRLRSRRIRLPWSARSAGC